MCIWVVFRRNGPCPKKQPDLSAVGVKKKQQFTIFPSSLSRFHELCGGSNGTRQTRSVHNSKQSKIQINTDTPIHTH